jgi:RHS repeat-associated protein
MNARSTRRSLVGCLSLAGAILGTLLAAQSTASAATSVFDGANRLVSTTEGSTTVTYAYDGLGNLAKRCVNGACTDLVLDDSSSLAQVVGEAPAGAATPTTYAYGPAGVVAQRGAASFYPMTDSLRSVRGLADATGALSGRRATDAFGATRGLVGAASGIGYAGEFTGAEDGKVWLRARSYDPKTGRFDQRDTFAGFASRGASLNRYSYTEGNPMNYSDPSGHQVAELLQAASKAAPLAGPLGAAGPFAALGLAAIQTGNQLAELGSAMRAASDAEASAAAAQSLAQSNEAYNAAKARAQKRQCGTRAQRTKRTDDVVAGMVAAAEAARRPETETETEAASSGGGCQPCPPPPPDDSRYDDSHAHHPCDGAHTHHYTYRYNQNPVTCQCNPKKIETSVTCH